MNEADARRETDDAGAGAAVTDRLDCTGLRCPLPLLRTKQHLARLAPGAVLEVTASDVGARRDIPAWLAQAPQHQLLAQDEQGGLFIFRIRRG